MIQNKNENFRDFRVFNFALHPKPKTQKSRKVLFYLIIYTFTYCCCIKIARPYKSQKPIIEYNNKRKKTNKQTNKQIKNIIRNEYQKQPPVVFYVFKNFTKFTGKHQCQSLFFNKVAGGTCNFIKRDSDTGVFQ